MNVIRAGTLGFCEGVRRAVEMAWRASEEAKFRQAGIYTLGPLIHNSRVLKSLEERGVICLEDEGSGGFLKAVKHAGENSTVIIRAHGVSPFAETALRRQRLNILDATCPHVKVSQSKARGFAERGYRIFLAGEKNHAEIAGIRGCVESVVPREAAGFFCSVVANPAEAALAAEDLFRRGSAPSVDSSLSNEGGKTVLIGQTTISPEEYSSIGEEIKRFFPGLEVVNTICGATADRQKALRELCGKVDAVIIAGGRESANTRRLLSLALDLGKPAWLVETQKDLPAEIGAYETVGLSAGASTPDDLIDEIEATLKNYPNLCKFSMRYP